MIGRSFDGSATLDPSYIDYPDYPDATVDTVIGVNRQRHEVWG